MITTLNTPFDQIITVDQIKHLRALRKPHGAHPLVGVAIHPGDGQTPKQRTLNTATALKHVLRENPDWVQRLMPRLLDEGSWSEADSALGELRAHGGLIEAGFTVTPGTKDASGQHGNTEPEFFVSFEGQEVVVEVWTRTGDKDDPARIAQEHEASLRVQELSNGMTLSSSAAHHVPFGMPKAGKAGDSVLTNVISRVAAVKQQEHQARTGKPFIVWLDLQGETLDFDNSSQLDPLSSFNGELYSGGYWYGFYGRKGDTLFEGDRFRRVGSSYMLHEGRFHATSKDGQPTKAAAFVLSSPEATAVFEHPDAENPLSAGVRKAMIDLPWFSIEQSMLNWTPGLVASTAAAHRAWVGSIADALKADEED